MCFDRTFPPPFVLEVARELDEGGADQLWVIEDCFYTTAPPLAAAALAVTERLQVGLGILPAVARNAAVTAMEISTLCRLGPGRVLPGIGHGVQSWMAQMGVRTPSPLTTLEEVITVVTRLLAGETGHLRRPRGAPRRRGARPATGRPAADPGRVRGAEVDRAGRPGRRRSRARRAGQPDVRPAGTGAGGSPGRVPPRRVLDPVHHARPRDRSSHRRPAARRAPRPAVTGPASPAVLRRARRRCTPQRASTGSSPCRPTGGPRSGRSARWTTRSPTSARSRTPVCAASGLYPAPDVEIARGQVDDVLALANR